MNVKVGGETVGVSAVLHRIPSCPSPFLVRRDYGIIPGLAGTLLSMVRRTRRKRDIPLVPSSCLQLQISIIYESAVLASEKAACLSLRYGVRSHLLNPTPDHRSLRLPPRRLLSAPRYLLQCSRWSIVLRRASRHLAALSAKANAYLNSRWPYYESMCSFRRQGRTHSSSTPARKTFP